MINGRWYNLRALAGAVLVLLALPSSPEPAIAQLQIKEVVARGFGPDEGGATQDALESAVSKVTGVRLASTISYSMAESVQSGKYAIADEFRYNIEKITSGLVKSFEVLQSGYVEQSRRVFVEIRAKIPHYVDPPSLERRKIAVPPLALSRQIAGDEGARRFGEAVSSALEAYLTQTRKFAVIDRRYMSFSDQEMESVSRPNARVEERAKLGQRVSADFLVLAVLKEFSNQQEEVRRPTGRVVSRVSAPALVDLRVIDVATGQIKFAHSYQNAGRLSSGSGMDRHAIDVGSDIGQLVVSAIYPIAIVAATKSEVIFNQGGSTVQIGRVYRLVRLGEELFDPYTRESLDRAETTAGRVRVVSVTDRTANAVVLEGGPFDGVKPGEILARLVADTASQVSGVTIGIEAVSPSQMLNNNQRRSRDADDW
jgi:hypothetical protein